MREECSRAQRLVKNNPMIQPCGQGHESRGKAQVVRRTVDAVGSQNVDANFGRDLLDEPGARIRGQRGNVVEGE